tara:strand:+ start:260 stop:1072 length:813 start_codon:yes stop_codon:yes gene_type:complete
MSNIWYNKLAVCGCSLSDRTKVKYAWGDYLAASLELEYLHFAGGAGSDKRGFRLLVQAIQKGEVNSKTLVLFQPSECIRRELPSHITESEYLEHIRGVEEKNKQGLGASPVYDKTLTGQLVSRFKIDSCHWQSNYKDEDMHLAYQERPGCLNYEFDAEMLSVYWYMLQGLCDSKGITLVMLRDYARGWPPIIFSSDTMSNDNMTRENFAIKEEWFNKSLWMDVADMWTDHERSKVYALNPPHDAVHFSEAGHIKLADDIEKTLREKGVLK